MKLVIYFFKEKLFKFVLIDTDISTMICAYRKNLRLHCNVSIAVITVEPADKISFVYNCMQRNLGVNKMGNDPLASFVCQDRW